MNLFRDTDTIVAIATPSGPGGIGVIRMSGSKALEILKAVFRPKNSSCAFKSHLLYYGFIFDPETGSEIDEALCVYMQAPRTYTREDVVEIQCHSGPAVLRQILSLCLKKGARLADPGEFTKRAFLSGRIDLVQAEAVDELVRAQTSGISRMSLKGLKGGLSEKVRTIKDDLLYCVSALEVAIDYPEEDSEILNEQDIAARLEGVIGQVSRLIQAFELSSIQRSGARVLLIGRPNAGKSSLLNTLSCEERAIVTEVPGTTRDIIEKQVEIGSIPVTLMDTAGVRHSPDPIEAMGIERIRQVADSTDVFLWLLDPTQGLGPEEEEVARLIGALQEKPVVVVINKIDRLNPGERQKRTTELLSGVERFVPKGRRVCLVSAKTGEGISELTETLEELLLYDERAREIDLAPNVRQKDVLQKVLSDMKRAYKGLREGLSPDIVAVDLRQALNRLGEITGETATEDILERIFSSFCLGK